MEIYNGTFNNNDDKIDENPLCLFLIKKSKNLVFFFNFKFLILILTKIKKYEKTKVNKSE